MDLALIDTDILSAILRVFSMRRLKPGDLNVLKKAGFYLKQHQQFAISTITRFEILRGLYAIDATAQLLEFENFCAEHSILQLTDSMIDTAARLWGDGYKRGRIGKGKVTDVDSKAFDNDLLIAATAIHHGRVLVTANQKHFNWIPQLKIENWRK